MSTEIDWAKFAARVPAGTIIRCQIYNYVSDVGWLIENYPYQYEEEIDAALNSSIPIDALVQDYPYLRCQWGDSLVEGHVLPCNNYVYFYTGEEWRSYAEVMA